MRVLLDSNAYSNLKRGASSNRRDCARFRGDPPASRRDRRIDLRIQEWFTSGKERPRASCLPRQPPRFDSGHEPHHRRPLCAHRSGAAGEGTPDSFERHLDRGAHHGDRCRPRFPTTDTSATSTDSRGPMYPPTSCPATCDRLERRRRPVAVSEPDAAGSLLQDTRTSAWRLRPAESLMAPSGVRSFGPHRPLSRCGTARR